MKYFLLFISLTLMACKTVTTSVETDDLNKLTMVSTEDGFFSCPKEKMRFTFTPDNGGQIASIYWENEKVAYNFNESYPNDELDLKEITPRVLDDGSGLIDVSTNVRGKFQLRRSFSFKYLEDTDEHMVEVIYNVKNYSSDQEISQKWIQQVSFPNSLNIEVLEDGVQSSTGGKLFKIETINVKDLSINSQNSSVKMGNAKSFKLGTKERLSWKVLYILKSLD